MLHSYLQFLKRLMDGLHTGGSSFQDYIASIGYGLLLILVLIVPIVVTVVLAALPMIVIKKIRPWAFKAYYEKSRSDENVGYEELDKLYRSGVHKFTVCIAALILIYLPIAIPTILFAIGIFGSVI